MGAFLISANASMVRVMKGMVDMKKKPITMKMSIMKRVSMRVRGFFLIQNLMFLILRAHM